MVYFSYGTSEFWHFLFELPIATTEKRIDLKLGEYPLTYINNRRAKLQARRGYMFTMVSLLQAGVGFSFLSGAAYVAYRSFAKTKQKTDVEELKDLIRTSKVLVLSKTYCGYCTSSKSLLKQLEVKDIEIKELDTYSNNLQEAAYELTGQRTVPNIFIGGKHLGGNDKLQAKHRAGELVPLLKSAGAL